MGSRRYTDEDLINAVRSSFSIAQVLRMVHLSPKGGNYLTIRCHIAQLGLDTSHFTGQGHLRGKTHSWTPSRPLAEILVKGTLIRNRSALKRRLIREGLLVNRCYVCGLGPVWQDKRLVMVLDHINGDPLDNRLENLRLLCPNCNSQQVTFAGKNKGRCVAQPLNSPDWNNTPAQPEGQGLPAVLEHCGDCSGPSFSGAAAAAETASPAPRPEYPT